MFIFSCAAGHQKNCFAVFGKFFKVLKIIRTTFDALDRRNNVDLGGVLEFILNNSWKKHEL